MDKEWMLTSTLIPRALSSTAGDAVEAGEMLGTSNMGLPIAQPAVRREAEEDWG
jgi:hypothetical protein